MGTYPGSMLLTRLAKQKASCVVRSDNESASHHDDVLDDQAARCRQIGKPMVGPADIRHKSLRRGDQEGKRYHRHPKREQTAPQAKPGSPDSRQSQQTNHYNSGTQSVGENISTVAFMPGDVIRNHLPFFIFMGRIFIGMVIEKRHKRAIRYERHNTVGFILKNLQATDPGHDNEYADPQKDGKKGLALRQGLDEGIHSLSSAGNGTDLIELNCFLYMDRKEVFLYHQRYRFH